MMITGGCGTTEDGVCSINGGVVSDDKDVFDEGRYLERRLASLKLNNNELKGGKRKGSITFSK